MKKRFVHIISALTVAAVLVSCGSGSDDRQGDLSTVTSDTTVVTTVKGTDTVVTETTVQETVVPSDTVPPQTEVTDVTTESDTAVTEEVPVINLDGDVFGPLTALLEAPPVEGATVAFYYEDIQSGISYSYNGDTVMHAASIIKVPYVMALLYDQEIQDMNLDEIYIYNGSVNAYGTGKIQYDPFGTEYTYAELIDYSLRFSDNVAFGALREKYGTYYQFDYLDSIGAPSLKGNGGWQCTAGGCGTLLRSVYEYIEGEYEYSEMIFDAMVSAEHTVMLCPGLSGKTIARKYGWDYAGYHDIGIVYDEHPYIIVFLSDMVSGGGEVNGYISTLAGITDGIHEELYPDGGEQSAE